MFGHPTSTVTESFSICGDMLEANAVQFRWMGSSGGGNSSIPQFRSDLWALSSIGATLFREDGEKVMLIEETFGDKFLK